MKKFSTIIIAMALVLGLGQCKKQETPATTDPEDGLVYITVNVGDDGAKHEVYPNTGAYVFTNGDTLYVGNNGHYVGKLGYKDGAFSGSITSPSTEDYLHFYFLGGLAPSAAPTAGSTTDFTVSIADQSSKLPILSYGQSTQKYTDANATYSTILRNKCGLVKFVLSEATTHLVTVSGLKTTATIDFINNAITPTTATGGITLFSQNDSDKWAILLEQSSISGLTVLVSGFEAEIDETTLPGVISNNMYYNSGVDISMTATCPEGAINGLFSVSADKQVYFSQGNLQYQASTNTWRFAEHQIDYVSFASDGNVFEGGVQCDNAHISSSYSGWIDLFGWGTSGYNHNERCYAPWSTSGESSYYWAYNNQYNNLYDSDGTADWGYNAISNGGNKANSGWRTLTTSEIGYVLNTRVTASGIRWAKGTVNGVNGIILLPDNWSSSFYTINDANGGTYDSNTISALVWTSLLEPKGVVFLPYTGGTRHGVSSSSVANGAYYLSNTYQGATVYFFGFNSTDNVWVTRGDRADGRAVRLVCDKHDEE